MSFFLLKTFKILIHIIKKLSKNIQSTCRKMNPSSSRSDKLFMPSLVLLQQQQKHQQEEFFNDGVIFSTQQASSNFSAGIFPVTPRPSMTVESVPQIKMAAANGRKFAKRTTSAFEMKLSDIAQPSNRLRG